MKTTTLEKPLFPAVYAWIILDSATRNGISKESLSAAAGIAPDTFDQIDALLPLSTMNRLLYHAIRLSGNDALGYEIGLQSSETAHGLVGYGVMSFPTVREAWHFGANYLRLRMPNLTMHIREEGDLGIAEIVETVRLGAVRQSVLELCMVAIAIIASRLMRMEFTGPRSPQLCFDFPQPHYYEHYRDRLPQMSFDMPANQIRFPRHLMDMHLETGHPVTATLINRQCEQELSILGHEGNIVDSVRAMLAAADDGYPSQTMLAKRLHMSTRTLKRRLQHEGVSFQGLLDEARTRASVRLLRESTLPVHEIAARLGYRNPHNFTRAFRKWKGLTPSAYRGQLESTPSGD